MLPNVQINPMDGGLGVRRSYTSIPQGHLGPCSAGVVDKVYTFAHTDIGRVAESLGQGPLTEDVILALSSGAKLVYAVPTAIDTVGACDPVTADPDNEGAGSLSCEGDAYSAYEVYVEVISHFDEGSKQVIFRYGLGGDSGAMSLPVLTDAGGVFEVPSTNLTLTFVSDGEGFGPFVGGDKFGCSTAAPVSVLAGWQAAYDALVAAQVVFDCVHCIGPSGYEDWIAMGSRAETSAETDAVWFHVMMEAPMPEPDSPEEHINNLRLNALLTAQPRISVVAAWGIVADPVTGRLVHRNLAPIVAGRLGRIKVHVSPGKVLDGVLPYVTKLTNAADPDQSFSDGDITVLDDARYVTARTHRGLPGIFVTNYRMMATPGSDYTWGENRRVMDKACREARLAGLLSQHRDSDEVDAIQADMQRPLDGMVAAGECIAATVEIPEGQDIVATSTLNAEVGILPKGTVRWLNVNIRFKNPLAAQAQ